MDLLIYLIYILVPFCFDFRCRVSIAVALLIGIASCIIMGSLTFSCTICAEEAILCGYFIILCTRIVFFIRPLFKLAAIVVCPVTVVII